MSFRLGSVKVYENGNNEGKGRSWKKIQTGIQLNKLEKTGKNLNHVDRHLGSNQVPIERESRAIASYLSRCSLL